MKDYKPAPGSCSICYTFECDHTAADRAAHRLSTFYPTPTVRFPACPVDGSWLIVFPLSHAMCPECEWLLWSMHPDVNCARCGYPASEHEHCDLCAHVFCPWQEQHECRR